MEKITATFPRINLTAAVKEVKDDDPSNAELQSLRIPEFVGGDPDVLMGIFYESCHPIKVHTLPSGLFIGKLQLASHDNKYTGVIGGPHASFRVLAEQAGGAANLMCTFVDGLKQYKNMGAPKIQAPLMTHEDIYFAKEKNIAEIQDLGCEINSAEDEEINLLTTLDENSISEEDGLSTSMVCDLLCSYCGSSNRESLKDELEDIYKMMKDSANIPKVDGDELYALVSNLSYEE